MEENDPWRLFLLQVPVEDNEFELGVI